FFAPLRLLCGITACEVKLCKGIASLTKDSLRFFAPLRLLCGITACDVKLCKGIACLTKDSPRFFAPLRLLCGTIPLVIVVNFSEPYHIIYLSGERGPYPIKRPAEV